MSAAAATARAAAAATAPHASSASLLRFRKGVTIKKPALTAAKTTPTAAPRARRRSSVVSVRAGGGAVAEDPLSEEERAELSLLDHADAIKAARTGYVGAIDVDEDGEPLTPEAIRVMQQKEEFWVGQERNYQKWYAPKQYGNVMSEFVGEVRFISHHHTFTRDAGSVIIHTRTPHAHGSSPILPGEGGEGEGEGAHVAPIPTEPLLLG